MVLVSAALLALCWAWLERPWDPISPFAYHRIRLGMTQREVEAVIGLSPGDHASRRPTFGSLGPGGWAVAVAQSGVPWDALPHTRPGRPGKASDGRALTVQQWWGDTNVIDVAFDTDGKAVGVYLSEIGW